MDIAYPTIIIVDNCQERPQLKGYFLKILHYDSIAEAVLKVNPWEVINPIVFSQLGRMWL